jgi:hypothetical protein
MQHFAKTQTSARHVLFNELTKVAFGLSATCCPDVKALDVTKNG